MIVHYASPVVSDICDASPFVQCEPPSGSSFAFGMTVVNCTAIDISGNISNCSFIIAIVDTTPPVITLYTVSSTVECGSGTYIEPGASAYDICAGYVPVQVQGAVDSNTLDTYNLFYSAQDHDENAAYATRVIQVVDTLPPVITLTGDPVITLECHLNSYVEQGASITDLCDQNVALKIGGDAVNANLPGIYYVTYNAVDASGNAHNQSQERLLCRTPLLQP